MPQAVPEMISSGVDCPFSDLWTLPQSINPLHGDGSFSHMILTTYPTRGLLTASDMQSDPNSSNVKHASGIFACGNCADLIW
jgi:hypothetical protein